MTGHIKREDAIKAVCDSYSPHSCNREDCDLSCQAASAIMALQAADVKPVVHSHWTDRRTIEHDGEWYCENCGGEYTICSYGKDITPHTNFCPNCGANMRECENGEN